MLDEQSVALVPVSGPVQVQGLQLFVAITPGPSGLGFVDPLLRDEQLLGEELLPADRLICVLQGAVQGQHVPHCSLSLTENKKQVPAK